MGRGGGRVNAPASNFSGVDLGRDVSARLPAEGETTIGSGASSRSSEEILASESRSSAAPDFRNSTNRFELIFSLNCNRKRLHLPGGGTASSLRCGPREVRNMPSSGSKGDATTNRRIDLGRLEREIRRDVAAHRKHRAEDGMKKRAVHASE